MTPYIILAFLLLPNGNVTAQTSMDLYLGADLCQQMREIVISDYHKQGFKDDQMTVMCVDSKLYVGKPA